MNKPASYASQREDFPGRGFSLGDIITERTKAQKAFWGSVLNNFNFLRIHTLRFLR